MYIQAYHGLCIFVYDICEYVNINKQINKCININIYIYRDIYI